MSTVPLLIATGRTLQATHTRMPLHEIGNGQFLTLDQGLFQFLSPAASQLDVGRVVAFLLLAVTPAAGPETIAFTGAAEEVETQDEKHQAGGDGDEF